MLRAVATLTLFAALAAWADAQTAPPLAADRVRLLRANTALLEDLVGHAVGLSGAGTRLDRAAECRRAVATFGKALQAAGDDPAADPDRVADLADQLADLIDAGLTPTLEGVRAQVRSGSLRAEDLAPVEAAVARDVAGCRAAVPADGRVGASAAVRRARQKLAAAADGVGAK